MRIFVRLVVVLVLLGVIFGGIFGWKYYQQQQQAAKKRGPQPATVASATVEQRSWTPSIDAVGNLTAVSAVAVTSEVAGIVRELSFESGDSVAKGDVLVSLANSVDRAALEALQAERQLARVQFKRNQDLLPRRAISQSEFDESQARYQSADARVAEQQAVLEKKTIRAPFSGVLGIRQIDIGEYLTPGQEMVSLQNLDPIYVDYSVPERRYPELEVGRRVVITVSAYPDRRFEGKISAINPRVSEGTRSAEVRATLPNAQRKLRPGMFAEVQTLRPQPREVLTIPRTAISFNTYGDYVYRIVQGEGDGLVVKRQAVTTGDVREGAIEVVKGLEADDRIVRAGLVKLRDGQAVTIDNSTKLDEGEASGE